METRVINPPELFVGKAFSQTFSVDGAKRLIFIAGQIDCDHSGNVRNPHDLDAQLKGTLENLDIALRAQGATMHDLVKVNFYIVGLHPTQTPKIRDIRAAFFNSEKPPAVTLVGIESLSMDGLLVEVEAIAAL